MSRDLNHMSHGRATCRDLDLCEMQQQFSTALPWMLPVLNELQYLRIVSTDKDEDENDDRPRHHLAVSEERIDYLESVLDKIGAAYEHL